MIRDFVSIFAAILCYLGYVYTAGKFCGEYLEVSGINEKLFMIFVFCGGVWMNIMGESYAFPYIFLAFLNHIFFMGLIILLYRGDTGKKILTASLLITITTLVENFSVSLLSCFTLFWQHTVKNMEAPLSGEWESRITVSISLVIVILAVYGVSKHITFLFLFPRTMSLKDMSGACGSSSDIPVYGSGSAFFSEVRSRISKRYVLSASPFFAITTMVDVASWGASHGILVRSGGNMGLYYDQIFSHAEFCILTLLSMFATGAYVLGSERIYLEQEKSSQYRSRIAAYKILEEQYTKSERLRHDLKNHIIALSGLLDKREWEKMRNYLKDMWDSADLGSGEENTGNRVVDVLLSQKRETAESKNIVWECDVRIPKKCCVNDFDLCILFGNLLDNAVEACERLEYGASHGDSPYGDMSQSISQRFIYIQAQTIKKCFLLEVKNSADMRERQKAGFTDRKQAEGHGIGLLNIGDVVHKYNGTMNVELQNGIFIISVLIPLNDAAHDMKQAI